jgi:hypothetical protein
LFRDREAPVERWISRNHPEILVQNE